MPSHYLGGWIARVFVFGGHTLGGLSLSVMCGMFVSGRSWHGGKRGQDGEACWREVCQD